MVVPSRVTNTRLSISMLGGSIFKRNHLRIRKVRIKNLLGLGVLNLENDCDFPHETLFVLVVVQQSTGSSCPLETLYMAPATVTPLCSNGYERMRDISIIRASRWSDTVRNSRLRVSTPC